MGTVLFWRQGGSRVLHIVETYSKYKKKANFHSNNYVPVL